ncbi:MAG: phage tail protein, partial [Caulobacteraceae bacterium]|nr:phage tail protein [Caulobacteraceae bacterium]
MPEYKAPSVYVEEVSLRAKSIEGASTTTTAFVGPTALGPLTVAGEAPPSLLTGFREFEGLYGGLQDLSPGTPNYLAHAVRVYFDNGGSRIYVARVAQAAGEADYVAALDRLLELKDVSIVAAPGASTLPSPLAAQVNAALIRHAETAGAYRFAVLDPPPSLDIAGVRDLRSAYDSAAAALYYPWVLITDPRPVRPPAQPARLALPPSGFVCGVYARGDVQRGVWKAPANETVTDAVGLQREVTSGEQEVLN